MLKHFMLSHSFHKTFIKGLIHLLPRHVHQRIEFMMTNNSVGFLKTARQKGIQQRMHGKT
jgi:hypothetical protein